MFFGEWLPNAQGEDVVAGIRTPNPVNKAGKTPDTKHLTSLEEGMPKLYKELYAIQRRLEKHYTICRTSSSRSRTAASGCSDKGR